MTQAYYQFCFTKKENTVFSSSPGVYQMQKQHPSSKRGLVALESFRFNFQFVSTVVLRLLITFRK